MPKKNSRHSHLETANFFSTPRSLLILILIVIGAIYATGVPNQFIHDDFDFIVNWPALHQPLDHLQAFLLGHLPPAHLGAYRPLRSLFYALSFSFFGLNPVYYHLQAILIHLLSTLTVYSITRQLAGKSRLSLTTAVLFGLHPLSVQAVAWITASFDTIGNLFFLASFYFYLRHHTTPRPRYFYTSLLLAAAAFFTNELTLSLPLVILAHQYLCKKHSFRPALRATLPFLILDFCYWLLRSYLNITSTLPYILGNPINTFWVMLKAFLDYFTLAFAPLDISLNHTILPGFTAFFYLDYNFQNLPSAPNLFTPQVTLAAIFVSAYLFFIYHFRRTKPMFSFILIWFLITLIPVMQIIPQSLLFTPRYSYLALFASSLLLALLLTRLTNISRNLGYLLTGLTLVLYVHLTLSQINTYRDEITYWTSITTDTPVSTYSHTNLAVAHVREHDQDEALDHFNQAVSLNPNYLPARLKLADYYVKLGQPDQALPHLEYVTRLQPQHLEYFLLLAHAYQLAGHLDQATDTYQRVLTLDPHNPTASQRLLELDFRE